MTIKQELCSHKSIDEFRVNVQHTRQQDFPDLLRTSIYRAALHRARQRFGNAVTNTTASVIIPTYNRADTLPRAAKSALAQTHKNLEVLVVDDGSTDDTEVQISHLLKDPRLKYIRQMNTGVSAARNTGLANAAGDFIFYLDSDNYWSHEHIECLLTFLLQAELGAGYSLLQNFNDNHDKDFLLGTDFLWEECSHLNYVDMNCFAHRKIADPKPSFDTGLRRFVDWDYILSVTAKMPTGFLPIRTVFYYNGHAGARITHTEYQGAALAVAISKIRRKHRNPSVTPQAMRELHPSPQLIAARLGIGVT